MRPSCHVSAHLLYPGTAFSWCVPSHVPACQPQVQHLTQGTDSVQALAVVSEAIKVQAEGGVLVVKALACVAADKQQRCQLMVMGT